MILFIAVSAAALGAAVGSFLNVVIQRVPAGESVVRPGSKCPACGAEVRGRDNIPVLSWILLRRRCRSCGVWISARYPLIEAANAGFWVAAVLRFHVPEQAALVAVACSVLLALSAIDLDHHRLPNAIVLPGTVGAAVWVTGASVASGDLSVVALALACGAAAFGLMFLLAIVSGGFGFGDVKLAAFIGIVAGRFGWEVAVAAVMGSFFVGGLVAVVLLVTRRAGRKSRIPFGPAMAAGAVLALFSGPGPVRAWLRL